MPKLCTVLRRGYSAAELRRDAIAGLTVAIVALSLAMALGGSRFDIGGPTGAFVVVVFGVVAEHGYDGLVVATSMAGMLLMIAGFAGLGS